jgi:hypothetical protein
MVVVSDFGEVRRVCIFAAERNQSDGRATPQYCQRQESESPGKKKDECEFRGRAKTANCGEEEQRSGEDHRSNRRKTEEGWRNLLTWKSVGYTGWQIEFLKVRTSGAFVLRVLKLCGRPLEMCFNEQIKRSQAVILGVE